MANPIQRKTKGVLPVTTLTENHLQAVASYTDPGTLINLLKDAGWSIEGALKDIAVAIKETDNYTTKVRFHKYLIDLLLQNIERSGLIGRLSGTVTSEDGTVSTFTAPAVSEAIRGVRPRVRKEEEDVEIKILVPKDTCEHKPPTSRHRSQFPGIAQDNSGQGSPPEDEGPPVPALLKLSEEYVGDIIDVDGIEGKVYRSPDVSPVHVVDIPEGICNGGDGDPKESG